MLLAVVSDPRLVLARLARNWSRCATRASCRPGRERRRSRRAIYAPLANRLGVWQLKWELEDLAFRYLEAQEYRRVAAALNERRADRERYIEALCAELLARLRAAGIEAEVYGRPKHIYSIYRKMQRKQLAFEQRSTCARCAWWSLQSRCYGALASSTVSGRTFRVSSTTTSPLQGQRLPLHPHRRDRSAGRSVEVQIRTRRCTSTPSWASRRTGPTRRAVCVMRTTAQDRVGAAPAGAQDGREGGAQADRDLIEGMRTELFATGSTCSRQG